MGSRRKAAGESLPAEWVPVPWPCPRATEVTGFRMCPPHPVGLGNGVAILVGMAGSFPPEAAAVASKLGPLENSPLGIEGGIL